MKINLSFVELHNPLFLNGKNHKQKLHDHEVSLIYDTKEKELYVNYLGSVAIIPSNNVASMTPSKEVMTDYLEMFKGMKLQKPQSTHANHAAHLDILKRGAQVSDPTTIVQNPRKDLGQ
jgi:hypothetical protein